MPQSIASPTERFLLHVDQTADPDSCWDKIRKGRAKFVEPHNRARGDRHPSRTNPEQLARGERQGSAKLTGELVRAIRAEYAAGDTSTTKLGTKYGVSFSAIARVITRETWKHID
jgi:hypothetical protein